MSSRLGNWHGLNPNTRSQEWSYWCFKIREAGRRQRKQDVEFNAAKWLRLGFGSVGEGRVTRTPGGWRIEARIDGESAADPVYVASVKRGFEDFVRKGWGLGAVAELEDVRVLAGDVPFGPRAQLLVIPTIKLTD